MLSKALKLFVNYWFVYVFYRHIKGIAKDNNSMISDILNIVDKY